MLYNEDPHFLMENLFVETFVQNVDLIISLFKSNKCHCLCVDSFCKFCFAPMTLGYNQIDWCK